MGEKGIALSGGQKARICLARAAYRTCPSPAWRVLGMVWGLGLGYCRLERVVWGLWLRMLPVQKVGLTHIRCFFTHRSACAVHLTTCTYCMQSCSIFPRGSPYNSNASSLHSRRSSRQNPCTTPQCPHPLGCGTAASTFWMTLTARSILAWPGAAMNSLLQAASEIAVVVWVWQPRGPRKTPLFLWSG